MAEHSLTLPLEGIGPKAWYQSAKLLPGFEMDAAQAQAIERLDRLFNELLEFKRVRARPFGKAEVLGHALLPQPRLPHGIYFWGGVGRGKSLLMDVFFSGLPYRRKRRMHFHAFMQDVHRQLREFKGELDPLAAISARIAAHVRVLCFDEFHVSDIADAMILGRLLENLFRRGVVLILTSNYAPENLYPDGLQRAAFLPTIALLQKMLDVVNLDGGRDHRQRLLTSEPVYLVPANTTNEERLNQIYLELVQGDELVPILDISGYRLSALRCATGVVWFDFSVLCGDQRSQVDYLYIARQYRTVLVSGIPVLGATQAAQARRLTWLVDVLYDYRVRLIATAAALPEQLYVQGDQAKEFLRTVSRLQEMQTREYLSLPYEGTHDSIGIAET